MLCKTPSARLLSRLISDVVILIILCCVAFIAVPKLLPTTRRGFFCSDMSIRYPYTPPLLNRVHITIAVIALPAAIMLMVEMLWAAVRTTHNKAANATNASTLVKRFKVQQFVFVGVNIPNFVSECYKIHGLYFFGLTLVLIATRVIKSYIGRLRPYFFDVCQPQLLETLGGGFACDYNEHNVKNITGYIDEYECYELAASTELLTMSRQSFPSGYTATITYAVCFVIFYLQARLRAKILKALRTFLQFGCLTLAFFVAIERYLTHNNHWSDLLASAILGFLVAAFVALAVSDLFKQIQIKRRKNCDDAARIYGYYGVNRVGRCY